MHNLIIKIKTKDKIEAYKIVNMLGFRFDVREAIFDGKSYKFDKIKGPKFFLKDK